jgi:hypothetical protein
LYLVRRGSSGSCSNLPTWEKGGKVDRHPPRDQTAGLKHAITGLREFLGLAEVYAEEIIRRSPPGQQK